MTISKKTTFAFCLTLLAGAKAASDRKSKFGKGDIVEVLCCNENTSYQWYQGTITQEDIDETEEYFRVEFDDSSVKTAMFAPETRDGTQQMRLVSERIKIGDEVRIPSKFSSQVNEYGKVIGTLLLGEECFYRVNFGNKMKTIKSEELCKAQNKSKSVKRLQSACENIPTEKRRGSIEKDNTADTAGAEFEVGDMVVAYYDQPSERPYPRYGEILKSRQIGNRWYYKVAPAGYDKAANAVNLDAPKWFVEELVTSQNGHDDKTYDKFKKKKVARTSIRTMTRLIDEDSD